MVSKMKKVFKLVLLVAPIMSSIMASDPSEVDICRGLDSEGKQMISFMLNNDFVLADVEGVKDCGKTPENSQKQAKIRIENFLIENPNKQVKKSALIAAHDHAKNIDYNGFFKNYLKSQSWNRDYIQDLPWRKSRKGVMAQSIINKAKDPANDSWDASNYSVNPSLKRATAK
jgi:hypothetical protein